MNVTPEQLMMMVGEQTVMIKLKDIEIAVLKQKLAEMECRAVTAEGRAEAAEAKVPKDPHPASNVE